MNIENVVKHLNSKECDPSSSDFASQLIKDAATYFQGPLDYSKLDQDLGLAFPAENSGLLVFMREKITLKPFENAKLEGFKLMTWLLQQKSMRVYVFPFCGRFKTICGIYWNSRRESARIQQAALDTLIALFENFKKDIDVTDFDAYNLYHELTTATCDTKFSPSVRGKIINLLGVVAAMFDDFFDKEENFQRLSNLLIYVLKQQVESEDSKLEPNIILGLLKAMDNILEKHGTKLASYKENWLLFCEKLEQIINPELSIVNVNPENKKLKRREFQRAGVEIIGNHGSSTYFSKILYDKYNRWYEDLLAWSASRNHDDSRVGKKAMFTFLQAVTSFMKKSDGQAQEKEKEFQEALLQFFVGRFNASLTNKDCSRNELTIAVKGAGLLLDVCSDSKVADNLFSQVMRHVEAIIVELNLPVTDKYSGSMGLITTYLESVGSMVYATKISDDDSLSNFQQRLVTVEQLSSVLITNFPNLGEKIKPFSHFSFLKVISSLHSKHHKYFLPFVERVFNETLNNIISSPTKLEVDILAESLRETDGNSYATRNNSLLKSVIDYAPFWTSLMKINDTITEAIYDVVMRWGLSTMDKLDLSIEFVEDLESTLPETISTDPIYNIKPNVVRDFQLFVNLVDFLQELILKGNVTLFEKWIEIYVDDLMQCLKNNPLVSGFYKLLSVVLKVADKIQYFNEDTPERNSVFKICSNFLRGIGVRIDEFRDDLLLSVLELWLSAPDKMLMENVTSLHNTSQIVFSMGRNHFPLALRGIETVDRWFRMSELSTEEMEKLVQNLFPIWKSYFVSAGEEVIIIHQEKEKIRSTKSQSKSKIGQRRVRRAKEEFDNATLKNVQLKLLHLFGSYGHLIKLGDDVKNSLSTEEQFLKYSLPFQDIKPDIYFDSLLPRILDLCHNARDRQTRSSACEFFHTLILYFLGFSVKTTGSSEHSDLFKILFKALLKFGCDPDVVVRQLFNPLTIQVVHWFTRKDNPYSDSMLRLIMDGLTQCEDAPLRDFSGVCLTEYFSWAVKHDNKSDVNGVMKFLFALSTHAAPQYRQGSVLGFNSIYKDFRENDTLRNVYSLQLIHSYISCLALSASFETDTILIRSSIQAIKHLERIILKKQDLFNTEMRQRKKPDDVDGYFLKNFVDWLLRQSGRIETICRQESIRLVSSLGPVIRGVGTIHQYLLAFQPEELRVIGEENRSQPTSLEDSVTNLLRTTEFYSFLFSSGYPIDTILTLCASTYFQEFEEFLETRLQDLEPKLGNIAVNIFSKLINFFVHFPKSIKEKVILNSVIVSKSFGSPENAAHLCTIWNSVELSSKLRKSCSLVLEFDGNAVSKNNIMENLRVLRWLIVLSKEGFIDSVLSKSEILLLRENIWKFILKNLFVESKNGSFEIAPVSLRMTELLQCLLELCIALKLENEKLIEVVFDPTCVTSQGEKLLQKFTKGEIFQKVLFSSLIYCEAMLDFNELKNKVSMENVGTLAQKLIQAVKAKKDLRKRFGSKLVENLLTIWTPLYLNCDRKTVARILSGLASINLNQCRNSQQVSQWWANIMKAPHLNLKDKSEMIHLFGLFALASNKEIVANAIGAVHVMVKTSITPQLKWNEEEIYITRITANILSIYERKAEDLKLVEVVVRLVEQIGNIFDADNRCSKEVQYKLRKMICSISGGGGEIAECLYKLITIENDDSCRHTLAACKYCLIPVISSLSTKVVKGFYRKNYYSIIQHTKRTPATIEDWNLKITAFYLLELLALKTDNEFLVSDDFNQSYVNDWTDSEKNATPNLKKAALRDFIVVCSNHRKTAVPSQREEKLRKANFQSNGASFNALVAILKATAQIERFYSAYIFQQGNNEIQWANIVDSSVTYNFPAILPQKEDGGKETKISTNKIAYDRQQEKRVSFSSRNKDTLVGSSLALEATEFDFTASVTVENCEFYRTIFDSTAAAKPEENWQLSSIEGNEVNQHESMVSFVETLRHMKTFGVALDADGQLIKDRWITNFCSYLRKNPQKNVLIFLIGAMLNCEDVFRPYAKHVIEPVLESVFSECFGEEKLNYFVKDIFVMLLGFHEVARPSSGLVKKVLMYLIDNIGFQDGSSNPYATRKDVYEHNLELLESVVKYWISNPETEIDVEFFTGKRSDVDKKYLDVCKYVLVGGQIPIKLDDVGTFLDKLCKGFRNGSKALFSVAAEAVGLALRRLTDINYGHMTKAMAFVKTKLDLQRTRYSAYLIMVASIQKHFTSFIGTQRLRIFELLSNQNVRSEAIPLLPVLFREIISCSQEESKTAQDFYSDLIGKHVLATDCKEESEIKAGVELFKLILKFLDSTDKIMKFVKWTSSALFCKDADVRAEYVTLLSQVYEQLPGPQQGFSLSSSHKTLLKMFVNLYNDENANVIERSQKFWSENLRRWNKSSELILELMELIGDDENAIPISLELLLKRCASSPDFKKKIFDKPLADCQFLEYKLDTSWRMRNASFQPLFAESISSSQSFSLLPKPFQASILSQRQGPAMFGMNLLRATLANLQFTPTNESSLMDSPNDEPMELDDNFSQELSVEMLHEHSSSQISNPLASLRRRFYERPPVETNFYARREIERQERQIQREFETVKSKRSEVKLSRSYRIGELPDIQITNSDLLATVSKLARSDQELGRQFLVILYTGIVEEIEDLRSKKHFLENSHISFNNVFKNFSSVMNPQFAAAVLEMSERNTIPIQANLVSTVCKTFDLQKLGIIKFENDLEYLEKEFSVPSSSKRTKTTVTEENAEADLWLRMADLYKDIDGFDVLRNIFTVANVKSVNSRDVYQGAKEALTLESIGRLEEACDKYADIFEKEQSDTENNSILREQFWEDSITKCLEKMSDWETLYNLAHKNQKRRQLNDLLEDTSYVERVLPLQIRSGVQMLLRDQSDEENKIVSKFKDFIEAARESEDNWNLLLERFPIDLALLTAIENSDEVARCGSLLDGAWSSSLKYFQNFDQLSYPQKKDQLLMLQKSASLQDILDWHRCFDIRTVTDKSFKLIMKWRRSCGSLTTPLTNSDVIVAQRDFFLLKLVHEVDELVLDNKDSIFQAMQMLNFEQHLWELNLSIINENLPLTTHCFKKIQTVGECLTESEKIQSRKFYAKHLETFMSNIRNDDWAKMWSSLWKRIQKVNVDTVQTVWEIKADLLQGLLKFCAKGNMSKVCESLLKNSFFGKEKDKQDSSKSKNIIGEAITSSLSLIESTLPSEELPQDLALKFYHILKFILNNCPEKYSNDISLHRQLLTSLLRGMHLGSSEAIRLFPTLFTILEKWPSLVIDFESLISIVPSWMFLPWLDQIVTNYHHVPSLETVSKGLIDRLILDFPQAFQLQYAAIRAKSSLPRLYSEYSKALSAIVLPMHRFQYASDFRVKGMASDKLLSLMERFLADLKEILDDGLHIYGKIHNDYAAELYPKVVSTLERLKLQQSSGDASNSPSQSFVCSEDFLKGVHSEITKASDTMHKKVRGAKGEAKQLNLSDLSPWLAKFHFSGFKEEIEIPGNYDSLCAPNSAMHPKIISFLPTVTIESSITEPISFAMMSNEGKNYKFLAKFGDDLRQDRRIQQCFRVSNEILRSSPRCRERKLHIMTYSVLPFNEDFGIIQWVQKTISMRKIIFPTKHSEGNRKDFMTFLKWIDPSGTARTFSEYRPLYWNSANNSNREEATKIMDRCIKEFNTLPSRKFKTFFRQRSVTIEDYFLIRENIIRSYATMCIVHWLLGIGDRHLENFLFSLETGLCIGIDFGRSFGSGISRNPLPELIPFRLTPQLQTILAPYGPKGLFKETMIFAWRALLQSSEQILSVVEVFVKDRGVNWLEERNKEKQTEPNEIMPKMQENLEMKENEMKLKIVKQKLSCLNPIKITENELNLHKNNTVKRIYSKVLTKGREQQLSKEKLTEEEVVEVLLDIATDKSILARLYVGMSAWI